jgi:hypothetical protein
MRPTESPTHDQTQPGWPAYTPTRHPNQDDHPNLAEPPRLQPQDPHAGHTPAQHGGHGGHGAHKWMMLLICLPLVLVGVWSFASGAGGGALVGGLVCMGMMAVMHLGMGGMGKGHRH